MPPMPVVQLARPLSGVRILTGCSAQGAAASSGSIPRMECVEREALNMGEPQGRLYQEACHLLEEMAARLEQLYREIFSSHHEAIARLAVEIARKILMRNISDGDYQIESIIKEALKNAPESSHTVVRLNPLDLANLQNLQAASQTSLGDVQLTADTGIGRAECVVENPKGMIKVLIEEHLEQIGKALARTG
jgi:flagellar biosynthesis/type III secretory pathway protein FliH